MNPVVKSKIKIKDLDQLTVISFSSGSIRENLTLAFPFLIILPVILALWAWSAWKMPPIVLMSLCFLILSLGFILVMLWKFQRRIEVHPEAIYIQHYPLTPMERFPRTDDMVLMMENHPVVHLGIPREIWALSIGNRDGIRLLVEEINDHRTILDLADCLSRRLGLHVVDYTYIDQLQQVMFYSPGELLMPFTQRVLRYPDLLVIGELDPGEIIREEEHTSSRRSYMWYPCSVEFLGRTLLTGILCAGLVWFNVVSTRADALVNIPFSGGDDALYSAIILYFSCLIVIKSGLQRCLELNEKEILLRRWFLMIEGKSCSLELASICHIRMKPSPRGLVLLIISREKTLQIYVGLSFKEDLKVLLWLTEKIQDFLLQNRPSAEMTGESENKT